MFSKTAGLLGALAVTTAISGAIAVAQAQSVAAVPPAQTVPDPAIAKGLVVFDNQGERIGILEDVVSRNGRQVAVVAVSEWPLEPAQRVEVPYGNMQVADGKLIYDVENAIPGDPLRRDPTDNVDWESLNEQFDINDE